MSSILPYDNSNAVPLEHQSLSVDTPPTSKHHAEVPSDGGMMETATAFIPVALEFGVIAAAIAINAWN
jgi:hypothetical protein